jgi:hypothetical protein
MRITGRLHAASFVAGASLYASTACVSVEPVIEARTETVNDAGAAAIDTVATEGGSPATAPSLEAGGDGSGGEPVEAASTDCPSSPGTAILGCSCPTVGDTFCIDAGVGLLCSPVPPVVGAVYEGPTWVAASSGVCSGGSTEADDGASSDATVDIGPPGFASPGDATSGGSSSGGGGTSSSGGPGSGTGSYDAGGGSSSGGGSAGGPDAGRTCLTDAECSTFLGERCGFPAADSCSALGTCFAAAAGTTLCATYEPGCACDGTEINLVCNGYPSGYASKPVLHPGPCPSAVDAALAGD